MRFIWPKLSEVHFHFLVCGIKNYCLVQEQVKLSQHLSTWRKMSDRIRLFFSHTHSARLVLDFFMTKKISVETMQSTYRPVQNLASLLAWNWHCTTPLNHQVSLLCVYESIIVTLHTVLKSRIKGNRIESMKDYKVMGKSCWRRVLLIYFIIPL